MAFNQNFEDFTYSNESEDSDENELDIDVSALYEEDRANGLGETMFCSAPVQGGRAGDDAASVAGTISDLSTRTVLATWGRYGSLPTNPSAGAVGAIVGLDVGPDFIANVAARAFAALDPVARAAGGDLRRAEIINNSDGRPAALRANGQSISLQINGRPMNIPMSFEGLGANDFVMLYRVPVSGGQWGLVAVHPQSNRSWSFGDVQYNADPTRLLGGGRGLMGGWGWVPNRR